MKKIGGAVKAYLHKTDVWLIVFCLMASCLSILFLYGLMTSEQASSRTVLKQAGAAGIGFLAAIVVSLIDYRAIVKLWKLYVPICVILCVLPLFPGLGGVVRGDNSAWLDISLGGLSLSLQPSEFLKISFITTLALHIERVRENMNTPLNILLLCVHGALHVLLIQLQGDSGSALVFLGIFLIVIFFAGINWKYIAAAVVGIALMAPLIWNKIMTPDQQMRFRVIFNPELDEAYAYQQRQGTLALGVGGLQGTGIFSGRHVRVPEVYNDFIFTFIGEATGFMGCLGVILLLTAIMMKILYNSNIALDDTGRLICVGFFGMILSQTVINLGMCLSILPVIGVTLPLFSSGGSSVLSVYLGIGLVLSVYFHSRTGLFYDKR